MQQCIGASKFYASEIKQWHIVLAYLSLRLGQRF